MGRQINLLLAMFVPFGRVHTEDSRSASQGKTERAPFSVDSDRKIDIEILKSVYCLIGNQVDPKAAALRKPGAIRHFAVWWREGSKYLNDVSDTWAAAGIRDGDQLVLLTERPNEDTKGLIDMITKQLSGLDDDAQRKELELAIEKGVRAAIGPHERSRAPRQKALVFIAMGMNESSKPGLADVHDALKEVCGEFGLKAVRVDDVQTNARITDTIRNLIDSSEFVIADLTGNRPNVFFEAGYAEGIGITPVYVAESNTELQFDVKDYPVIFYQNIRTLRELVRTRLRALVATA